MTSANEARQRYIAEYPNFQQAAGSLKIQLERLVDQERITGARVKVRAKEVSSFVKKLRKYGDDCWDKTTDKVGAQVVVGTLADVRQIRTALEAGTDGLEHLHSDEKSPVLSNPQALTYAGVHVQVRLEDLMSGGEPIEAEVQLRTQAQDIWANLEHGLVYKPVVAPSLAIQRKIARLSVLVEMFDEEVDAAMGQLSQDARYEPALLLREAERLFLTMVTQSGEPELSLEVLSRLLENWGISDWSNYAGDLRSFVTEQNAKLRDVLLEYGEESSYAQEFNYVLFTQPESLILLEMIENRPVTVARAFRGTDLEPAVAALADVWGAPLMLG
ncbi:GTP pyrophosphokinase [Klenkia taihuensis]|uniref:PpGpp synthetase catalytic domain-containing protein (RelA/SpoT-type nucleotidyltranferase) n=1 Tax=Klenkia taihuensis TaxID=1225127 RepID=A0A1I1Q3R8_9ACTN|nr:hypothetical protein [Klenkia taihuensis]GHE08158.1 hypothetical protein GCM10011381_07820 [Klenkia taihuensis]SFD16655.1 ppGpp synthetase catalytic domain-containing protein (RelA/SpoT-type nucleotidyltranferase) [Klenkia taihuensis]